MTTSPMDGPALIEAAEKLVPLIKEKARESELARQPLDEVITAIRDSGLYSMMVPREHGGHEADIDTFFEVTLLLSRADASTGWLTAFYIEHNYWALGFPKELHAEMFAERPYILAPVSMNAAGGGATSVDGGYRLSGQWSWGTGIMHADWAIPVAIARVDGKPPTPMLFLVPRAQTETVDTWFVSGMCGTGSQDYRIEDVFVPESHATPIMDFFGPPGSSPVPYDAPIYQVPLAPLLGFAAGLPALGAAQGALQMWSESTAAKIDRGESRAGFLSHSGKPSVAAHAALTLEAAESLFRSVLAEIMDQRYAASIETRTAWMSRIAHGVAMSREAMFELMSVTGSSDSRLDSPIQRAMRDVTIASNHVFFDRQSRYGDYGRLITGQAPENVLA